MLTVLLLGLSLQTQIVMRVAVTVPVLPAAHLHADPCVSHFFSRTDNVQLSWTPTPDWKAPGLGYWLTRTQTSTRQTVALNAKPLAASAIGYTDTKAKRKTRYVYSIRAAVGAVYSPAASSNVVTTK